LVTPDPWLDYCVPLYWLLFNPFPLSLDLPFPLGVRFHHPFSANKRCIFTTCEFFPDLPADIVSPRLHPFLVSYEIFHFSCLMARMNEKVSVYGLGVYWREG
jgi:hypothetical protein